MPDPTFSVSEVRNAGSRVIALGICAIVALLVVAGTVLLLTLPDGNAFNARIERLFVENDLTTQAEVKLLEILAQSGTAFADTLASYRMVIFVLLVFATAMMIAALVVLAMLAGSMRSNDTHSQRTRRTVRNCSPSFRLAPSLCPPETRLV